MAQPLRYEDTVPPAATALPDPALGAVYTAYRVLHVGFTVAPIIAGLDKFFMYLASWPEYLAPTFPRMLGVTPESFMKGVGIIEIVAGILVALKPRFGGYLVMLWLWGIILNLFLVPGIWHHVGRTWGLDIALRDFGLSLGAFALAQLATFFERRQLSWHGHPARVDAAG